MKKRKGVVASVVGPVYRDIIITHVVGCLLSYKATSHCSVYSKLCSSLAVSIVKQSVRYI